jgi:hypothetical protein
MDYEIITHRDKRYIVIPRLLELGLRHVFTTRDMDTGLKTNPCSGNLLQTFEEVKEAMGIDPLQSFFLNQIHSARVVTVEEGSEGLPFLLGQRIMETDGMATSREDFLLVTTYADCVPLIFFDPVKRIQANVHSGWKGTAGRIAEQALQVLRNTYGCRMEDVVVVIGPHIGRDDFEVETDVKRIFEEAFPFSGEVIRQKDEKKSLIDLHAINRRMLLEQGISAENILSVDLSTVSHPDLLHSYRRDGKNFGLMSLATCIPGEGSSDQVRNRQQDGTGDDR